MVAMVDYDTDPASRSMQKTALDLLIKGKGWKEETVSLVRSLVQRSDLLQVGDRNYRENLWALATDFCLRRPDYANHWKGKDEDPTKAVEPKTPFYLFARKRVVGEGGRSWRFADKVLRRTGEQLGTCGMGSV